MFVDAYVPESTYIRFSTYSFLIIKLPFSAKNMVGGGVLSLSGGIALYANSPKAAVSAMLIVTMWGAIFGYFCLLIGRSCDMSLAGTYRECWERSVAVL